jgi:hypothetical protein
MNRLIHFVSDTFGRRERRGRSGSGETNAWPTDLDPWSSYVKVLEEARQRRGRLFSRSS